MTIIVGLHDPDRGETWIGADGRALECGTPAMGPIQKWVVARDGRRAIGLSGQLRAITVLRNLDWENLRDVFAVAERVRDMLRDDGFNAKPREDAGGAPSLGQQMIYAEHGSVWDIDATFSIVKVTAGRLWARGSGMDFGLGADHASRTLDPTLPPATRVRHAIEAAIEHDVGCGAPIFLRPIGTT